MSAQLFVNALGLAAILTPAALAFTLLFSLLRFANFAIGGLVTVGAFGAWAANTAGGLPLWAAALCGMAAASLVAVASDIVVFRPMRQASATALLLVSIALSFVIESVLRFAFGGGIAGFDLPLSRPVDLWQVARIAPEQVLVLAAALAALVVSLLVLRLTPFGRALRAVADDPALAMARGIRVGRIELGTVAAAGALAGLTGTLAGVDLAIDPIIGWTLIVPILAAALLGGIGSASGAALGALLVGLAEEAAAVGISAAYKSGAAFVVIALVLLVRPRGLLGQPVIRK